MLIFSLLAIIAIIRAGHGNSWSYFNPSSGPSGFSGVGLAVVFGLLSFIGFEAAAMLGEETGNPRRNVPLAVRFALIGVGVFFVFVVYGLAAGFHLNTAAGLKAFLASPAQFTTLAQTVRVLAQAAGRPGRHRGAVLLHARRAEHHRAGGVRDGPGAHHPREPVRGAHPASSPRTSRSTRWSGSR